VVKVLLCQTLGTLGASGFGWYIIIRWTPPSPAAVPPSSTTPPPPPFTVVLFTPDKPFQLSSPHLLAIPLMANTWPTPHQPNYVCHIMRHHRGIPGTLAHCLASFPRSHPQQMVPFQLISGRMQLSQTRMLLYRIAPVQSAQGPETWTIKRPRVP
jgi:hypothetical protein